MRLGGGQARFFAACGATVCVLAAVGQSARADVTIVSEVVVKGVPTGLPVAGGEGLDKALTTTVYYKNKKQRTESGPTVVIYDGETDKMFTLNPAAKTYTVAKGAGGVPESANAALMNPMLSQLKITAKTFVHPGNQTQTIAGRATKNTRFMAILKMNMATGDALGAPGGANIAGMLPTIILKGEEWMADDVLPPGEAIAPMGTGMANLTRMMPGFGTPLKDFAAQIAALKGFPLASTFSTTIQFPEGSPAAAMGGVPKEPIVVTTRAKSVSNAPIDDALFTVPADYKQEGAAPDAPTGQTGQEAPPVPVPPAAPAPADPVKPL